MKKNIGLYDRILRGILGVVLLIYGLWANSWLALGFSVFTFYEALSSWCVFYALIGKSSCTISENVQVEQQGENVMLNARKLGLSGGILWGATMFIITLISMYSGYASQWSHLMMDIYPGYTLSWSGSIAGLLYGFLDGFVGFYLLGWLYNKLE